MWGDYDFPDEPETIRRECPDCGSTRVETDGDYVEDVSPPDGAATAGGYYEWFTCGDCGRQWREQPEKEQPALDAKAGLIAAIVGVILLILFSVAARGADVTEIQYGVCRSG